MVILCGCLVLGPLHALVEWDLVEFFSGDGRISRLAAKLGIQAASYEILLGEKPNKKKKVHKKRSSRPRNTMDFNGECGFAPFGPKILPTFRIFLFNSNAFRILNPTMATLSYEPLRLAVALLLQSTFQQVVVMMAPPCSTWISINAGTSKRTILCPAGDTSLLQNRKSNKLACRLLGLKKKCGFHFSNENVLVILHLYRLLAQWLTMTCVFWSCVW